MATQKCISCNETFTLNEFNFRWFKTGKWAKSCTRCAKIKAKDNYRFRNNLTRKQAPKGEPIATYIRKKDITRINLIIDKYYTLVFYTPRERDATLEFIGRCIFQNDRYFVLETDNNIRESFLKVDSILNIYKLKKGRC